MQRELLDDDAQVPFGRSLRTKVVAFAFVLVGVSVLVGGAAVWWTMADELLTREEERLAEAAHDAALQFGAMVDTGRRDALMLAGAPAVQGFIRTMERGDTDQQAGEPQGFWKSRAADLLTSLLQAKPAYREAAFFRAGATEAEEILRIGHDGDAIVPLADDGLAFGSARSDVAEALRPSPTATVVSAVRPERGRGDAAGARPVFRISARLRDSTNQVFGLIVLTVDAGDTLAEISRSAPAYALGQLMDSSGEILHLSMPDEDVDADPGMRISPAAIAAALGSGLAQRARVQVKDQSGSAQVIGAHDLAITAGAAGRSVRFLYAAPYAIIRNRALAEYPRSLAAAALAIWLALPLALMFGSALARPLRVMTAIVTGWRPGASFADLPTARSDEIGLLAREFSRLLGKVGERQVSLEQEIAKRKLAEAATHAGEVRHRAVIDSMIDGMVVSDATGAIVSVNPAIVQMFGYTSEELIGQSVTRLAREQRRAAHAGLVANAGANRDNIVGRKRQLYGQRKTGEVFPIELILNQFDIDDQRYYSAVIRDQTQQHATETELRRMAAAVDSAADAIVIQDVSGRIQYINRSYERILGLARTDVVGRSARDLGFGTDAPEYYEALWATLARGEVWIGPLRLRTPAGVAVALEATISPVSAPDGTITHHVTVMRDVTGQRELESQLARAQKLEAIGQLAAGIAHEINTPVQYVGDNIRFVRDAFAEMDTLLGQLQGLAVSTPALAGALAGADLGFLREEVPRALDQSADGCQRIATIVKAMKEFSHPGQEKAPVDLNRAIQSTITVASNEWKYVAEVRTEFDAALPAVTCLPGEFNQVILNMLVNAAHAIGDVVGAGASGKGTITVSTRAVGEFAEIRISDTGGGITPEVRAKIFDPFFTTKAVGRGTGQGLAIAHDVIVNKHGGSIALESEPGKGATFIVRIPINPPGDAAAVRAA